MNKHIYSKAYSQLINLRPDLENKYVELNILISMKKLNPIKREMLPLMT